MLALVGESLWEPATGVVSNAAEVADHGDHRLWLETPSIRRRTS